MQHYVEIEQLLKAGAHFGHMTSRWNPAMSKFIFTEKNGIHIIDLRKTQVLADIARDAAYDAAAKGKIILFVGTKPQAKAIVSEQASRAGMNYVSERWLGGMLTNFATIRKSIKRLGLIDKMEQDGTYEKITKKERLMLDRERERLRKVFGGIEFMTRLPGVIFVVDIKKEHLALKEAKTLGIPVIAVVDTNCDPNLVDYPIPANDDSNATIELLSGLIADAVLEGTEIARNRQAEMATDSGDKSGKDSGDHSGDGGAKRKLRERKPGGGAPRGGNKPNKTSEVVENAAPTESNA